MQIKKLTIGISSCLLGQNVRYDGKSKKADSLIQKLEQIVELLPICPEVEIGMIVPRERVQLQGSLKHPRMIAEESQKDWTNAMNEFSLNRIVMSDFLKISALILKSKSPSCGIKTTQLFKSGKLKSENGTGLFASVVQQKYPNLPIIDELSLKDVNYFEIFINQAIEYSYSK